MDIIYFLVGCSVFMAIVFLAAFFWTLKNGQQDDMYTPSVRILFEDRPDTSATASDDKNDEGHKEM